MHESFLQPSSWRQGEPEEFEGAVAITALPVPPSSRPAVTWRQALEAWRNTLQSEATRETYTSAVQTFFRTSGAPDLSDLDADALERYGGALRYRAGQETPVGQRLAPATVNLKLAALRSFVLYCRRRRYLSPLLTSEDIRFGLQGMRSQVQRPYQVLAASEMRAVLEAAAADAYDAARALALIGLALGAGLRVAELCALDVCDIACDATGYYVDVRAGKGHKQRQVPIAADVYALALAYLEATDRALQRAADRSTPLLLSRKHVTGNGRLTTRQARRIIVGCARRAGVSASKRITPHALRHSYAIRVLAGDPDHGQDPAPLPAVSKLLGHSSIAVTGRYLAHFERRDLSAFAPTLEPARSTTGNDA